MYFAIVQRNQLKNDSLEGEFILISDIPLDQKMIESVLRNQKEGYGWYMLGFWFFPIGIWIIQPRVIELLEK